MAPLPKRRHSTRRGGKRKAAIRLSIGGLVSCAHCGAPKLSHRVCPVCGYYGDKKVITKKEKTKKSK